MSELNGSNHCLLISNSTLSHAHAQSLSLAQGWDRGISTRLHSTPGMMRPPCDVMGGFFMAWWNTDLGDHLNRVTYNTWTWAWTCCKVVDVDVDVRVHGRPRSTKLRWQVMGPFVSRRALDAPSTRYTPTAHGATRARLGWIGKACTCQNVRPHSRAISELVCA